MANSLQCDGAENMTKVRASDLGVRPIVNAPYGICIYRWAVMTLARFRRIL